MCDKCKELEQRIEFLESRQDRIITFINEEIVAKLNSTMRRTNRPVVYKERPGFLERVLGW